MGKCETYLNETDLHRKLMDFLNPETEYGLTQQLKNVYYSDYDQFKAGAMWGCAMFLIFAGINCEKIYLGGLTEEEEEALTSFKDNYQYLLQIKETIFNLIESEKKHALDSIEPEATATNYIRRQLEFEYHRAVCELGDKIKRLFSEE